MPFPRVLARKCDWSTNSLTTIPQSIPLTITPRGHPPWNLLLLILKHQSHKILTKFLMHLIWASQINIKLTETVFFIVIPFNYRERNLCGIMAKVLDCSIEVNEFKFQLCYYVHFQTDTFGKGMYFLFPTCYGLNGLNDTTTRMAFTLNNLWGLICH